MLFFVYKICNFVCNITDNELYTVHKKLLHPLEQVEESIEKLGVIVLEGVDRMPVYHEPFISSHMVVVLNHQGFAKGEYDLRPVNFGPHDFSVVYPNHTILANESSDDYNVTFVVISQQFFEQIKHRLTYGATPFFHSNPLFHLTDEQYQCMIDIVKLIKSVSSLEIDRKMDILTDIIDVLSQLARNFRIKTEVQPPGISGKESATGRTYFYQFYDLLVEHYLESREVAFYANKLCVSPKYFGFIIKQETGIGAGQWIAWYTIIRAKALLRHRTDLSVQQISNLLNFPDASSFSRYFRQNSGMTAKEYRDQYINR